MHYSVHSLTLPQQAFPCSSFLADHFVVSLLRYFAPLAIALTVVPQKSFVMVTEMPLSPFAVVAFAVVAFAVVAFAVVVETVGVNDLVSSVFASKHTGWPLAA